MYRIVVSSGAIIPARAPPSIDMLQMVILCSMDRSCIALPRYSMTCRVPPDTPIWAMIPRIKSLAATPQGSSPSTSTAIECGLACQIVWVARTCSTSVVPIPKARAPKAPWVEVWLSPHTTSRPGWVRPCSGPTTWTIPCRGSSRPNIVMPWSLQFSTRASICRLERGSRIPRERPVVGMPWSTVATVRSGRLTVLPDWLRPANACGEVTSWTRCRST